MLILTKYLKPFGWVILLIFLLLAGQAAAELTLPNYMSRIVNVGIQQNGIENAVPRVMRVSEYEKLAGFMSSEQQALVLRHYRLIEQTSLSPAEYADYLELYPVIAAEPVYELTASDKEIIRQLEAAFGPAILSLSPLPEMELPVEGGDLPEVPDEVFKSLVLRAAIPYLTVEYEHIGLELKDIQLGYMLPIGFTMLAITLGGAAAAIYVGYLSSKTASKLARDLRLKLFRRVESFSNIEFDKFSTASLITRTTNDIQQIQMLLVMLLRIVFFAPIMGIGGFFFIVTSEASMWWVLAVAIGAMVVMVGTLFTFAVPKFKIIQKLVDRVNLVTREILSGLLVIRAFNTQQHEEKKFDAANAELTRVSLFINRIMVIMNPTMMFIMNGAMLLIIWVGAIRVDAGTMQVGDMMAFMQYAMLIIFSFLMISLVFIMLPRALVSIERINEVLVTEPSIRNPEQPSEFPQDVRGLIEFRDVSFRYPAAEEDLLKSISFVAKPGETTAIIGSTGSGKSTIINLIPRFYDITGGQILVDGIDIRDVKQSTLRDKIGYVPQRASLFSGTIESNLRYADENASDEVLQQAIVSAQARDFIKKSEEGMKAPVAQGATNLSGGQKQRLSIARALVKQPEIFIFDDSFSALDFKTDAAVRRALKRDTKKATVLIVTQRISTIMGAEQIIVLDRGEIVGIGRHHDLLKTCSVYREIAQSQLSEEELDS